MTATLVRDTKPGKNGGSFGPAAHREFVGNVPRINAFKKTFERLALGKTLLDVGTGSGIMAILAARAGAKKVIAVEKDEVMAEIALANFERNGLSKIIHLIRSDALRLTRSDLGHVDFLVGELLSTWCVVEPQVPVFKHLLNILGSDVVSIPHRIINCAEGVHAQFGDAEGLVIIPHTFFEFESVRPKAEKLTTQVNASEVRFSSTIALDTVVHISLRALRSGILNGLRLTSITETCEGVRFYSSDDTMPRMIVPLPREIAVIAGQVVNLTIRYTYAAGWDKFIIDI